MNLASIITEEATVMAIVRDRAERLWRRKGNLSLEDMEYATRSTYIRQDKSRQELASEYFNRMVDASRYMSSIMSGEKNEQIYERFFGVKPKHQVRIESRPYGVHFILHDEDIGGTGAKFEDGVGGVAHLFHGTECKADSRSISHSIGRRGMSIDKFARMYVEKIIGDKALSEKFERNLGIGLGELMDAYRGLKSNSRKHWFTPKWEKVAKEMECEIIWEHFGKYIMRDYLKMRDQAESPVSEHELEHLHSQMMLSLSDLAVHEAVSYSTPLEIETQPVDLEFESKFSTVYSDMGKENMRGVLDVIKEARKRKLTGFQKKVLPIAFSRSGAMSKLSMIYTDILDDIEKIN